MLSGRLRFFCVQLRKKATKRKETDVDFEEKRVTLMMDEDDKENKENEGSPGGKTHTYFEPSVPLHGREDAQLF